MFEVGKTYETKNYEKFECIVVTETHAWMKSHNNASAYVWTHDGKSVSLSIAYDIKPQPRDFWLVKFNEGNMVVSHNKPLLKWDEIIHVREVLPE